MKECNSTTLVLMVAGFLLQLMVSGINGKALSRVDRQEADSSCINIEMLRGLPGPTGPAGNEGEPGERGDTGPMGPPGPGGNEGKTGESGETGPMGPPGPAGNDGKTGESGDTGPMGPTGPAGNEGEPGERGETGPMGPPGPAGNDGRNGERGDTGPMGPPGSPGNDGRNGERGHTGSMGPPGPAGNDGRNGERGETGPPGPAGSSSGGVTYIRWGRTVCPSEEETERLYEGIAAGSYIGHKGGSATHLCLPKDPVYSNFNPGVQGLSPVYGMEYENPNVINRHLDDYNVPCAVCYAPTRSTVLMVPAKNSCPSSSWTLEYSGYLMTARYTQYRSSFECVDKNADYIPGSGGNDKSALFYPVEATCSGIPCGPYETQKELTCAVCTR